jgi:hypothetical protein
MIRRSILGAFALAACLGAGGCLVSSNPFYEAGDIVRDDHLIGTYVDRQDEVFWKAVASPSPAGRYEVLLADHGAISHFLGTLFRIGDATYLDLTAIGAVAVFVDPAPVSGVPSLSQRMSQLVGDGRQHLVLRIFVTPAQVTYWFVAPDILKRLPKEDAGPPSPATNPSRVVLDRPTRDLRALLRKYGTGDILFTEKTVLQRYPPGQPAPAGR